MGDQIITIECYFRDGEYCEFYGNDCEKHPTCNGESD